MCLGRRPPTTTASQISGAAAVAPVTPLSTPLQLAPAS